MAYYHSVVWIDHHKATVWQFTSTEAQSTTVHSRDQHDHVHSRKSTHGGHKHAADAKFLEEVTAALSGTHEILLMGPAQAKVEFAAFLKEKHAVLAKGIVAVESADHPSDAQVLAYARKHFKALDQMFAPDPSAPKPAG